jgi:hypothetical protein
LGSAACAAAFKAATVHGGEPAAIAVVGVLVVGAIVVVVVDEVDVVVGATAGGAAVVVPILSQSGSRDDARSPLGTHAPVSSWVFALMDPASIVQMANTVLPRMSRGPRWLRVSVPPFKAAVWETDFTIRTRVGRGRVMTSWDEFDGDKLHVVEARPVPQDPHSSPGRENISPTTRVCPLARRLMTCGP